MQAQLDQHREWLVLAQARLGDVERERDEACAEVDQLREELAAMEHLCAAHELSLHSQGGALSRAERERDEARERHAAAEECADFAALTRDAALAEVERLRGRLGVLERAVLMADGADSDEGQRDLCMFCGEEWREDDHKLVCPRRMADVIRRERSK